MTELRCDLLVLGAGPAGSALAAAAAARGRDVMLIEAAHHPRPKVCAEYASPRIAEELARLGVDGWREAAIPLRGMRVIFGDASAEIRYADRSSPRTAWGLDRRQFDAVLANHAVVRGARLLEGTRLVDLLRRGDRVSGARVATRDSELEIGAEWVVGADGARSRTARLLRVERPVRFPRRLGLVAHYEGIPGLDDHGEMHVGDGYYVGLAPMPGGELNVGMALPMGGGSAARRFSAAIAGLPAVAARLRTSTRITAIRGAAPIGHRVSEVAGPGWLLVGDAAGFVDPFTGEGIYRALRSARAAADALLSPDPAASYRAGRRAAFSAKDVLTWAVQSLLIAPPLFRRTLSRLHDRPTARLRIGSALGDCLPATEVLTPRAVFELLRP
ncbi:MAG: geranylgeranyl reductase family protein [Chloroflexota bacterium]|nr:geranylgeranyl reductase family protein [Chloroflexota bacterium]